MRPELEVYLTTYDGAQHLRLHGWLKRNTILIKSETINKSKDYFGMFMVYINDKMLDKLKEANIEQGMYCDMEVMGSESSRLDLFNRSNPEIKFDWGKLEDDLDEDGNFPLDEDGHFDPSRLDNLDKFSNGIKSFMFSLDLQSPERMDEFIKSANEMSLKLFKREDEFVEEYVKTPAMSSKEKIKDIEIMIEYFIENGERYEDCAILYKVKERIINYEINNLYKQVN
tara:strand:- start:39 stop:719 length:681 start_codon:yes stop_codon:yes gene_type:complete